MKAINAFCERLNAGLAAVALILFVMLAIELTIRLPAFALEPMAGQSVDAGAIVVPDGPHATTRAAHVGRRRRN